MIILKTDTKIPDTENRCRGLLYLIHLVLQGNDISLRAARESGFAALMEMQFRKPLL